MQVNVRQRPSFAVARLMLAPGEPAQVESGAMVATSYGVHVQSQAQGGIMKSLGRAALGGESFFVSTYTAPQNGGWVRKVSAGMIQSLKSGEGFVFDFVGSGQVMTQTRNPGALSLWVRAQMPSC